MSGQSAKKKRLGSRRTVSRQKETPEAGDFAVTESVSAAPQHIAEESNVSVNAVLNPNEFGLETAQTVPMNRRKLGSSRRHKGKQHGKDSEINTGPEVSEEVEENTSGQNTFETTQMSAVVPLESQIEISHLSEHAISAPLKSTSTSTVPQEYCSEDLKISPTICPEETLESLPPKNENKMQLFQNEESKENPHEDTTSQLSDSSVPLCPLEKKQLVSISSLNSMDKTNQGLSHVYSVEEIKINKSGNTEINTWSTHLQGSSLTSDSFEELVVLESKTPDTITDQSSAREIIEMEHSLAQPVIPNEKQNEHFNISQGRYAQHSEDLVNKVNDERQDVHREEKFSHSLIPEEELMNIPNIQSKDEVSEQTDVKENPESRTMSSTTEDKKGELSEGDKHNMSVSSDSSTLVESEIGLQLDECDRSVPVTRKGPSESDSLGSEEVTGYHCSESDVKNNLKEEVALLDTEKVLDNAPHDNTSVTSLEPPTDQTGIINIDKADSILKNVVDSATNEDSSNSTWKPDESLVELGHVDESKDLGNSSGMDEKTETDSGSGDNGCMSESSFTQEERQQLKESEIELSDNADSGQTSQTITMPLTTETKKEQSLFEEYDTILSVSHDSPISSVSTTDYSSEVQNSLLKNIDTEMEDAIPECTNIVEDRDIRETDVKMEVFTKLNSLDSSVTLQIREDKDAHLSKDEENVSQDEVIPTQNPTISHHTSCHIMHEGTDLNDSEIIHGNPTNHSEIPKPHQCEVSVKNTSDHATWQIYESTDGVDPVREIPTKEIHLTLESERDWDFMADSKELRINHSEIGDIALGSEDKHQLHHDVKLSNERSVDQKSDAFGMEDLDKTAALWTEDIKNEKDHLQHAKKPQISDVDRQCLSSDCTDGLKGSTEDVVHMEKEELFFETAENKPAKEKVYSKVPFGPEPLVNLTTELHQTKNLMTLVETITDGIDKSDPLQVEKEHDGEIVNTSELTVSDRFANPSGAEWIIDQAQCSQMSHDEHSSIVPVEDEGTDNHMQVVTFEEKVENYSVNEPFVSALTVIATEKSGDEEQTQPEECVDGEVDLSKPVQKQEMPQVFGQSLSDKIAPGDIFPPKPDIKGTEDCLDIVKFSDLSSQQVISEQNSLEVTNQGAHGTDNKVTDDIEKVHSVKSDMETCAENTDQGNNGHFCPLQQNNPDHSPGVNQEILRSSKDEFAVIFLEETDKPGKAKSEHENVDAKQMTHFSSEAPLSECSNLTSDQQLIKSDSNEMPDKGLPTLFSVSEDKETDKGTETLKLAERFLGNDSLMDVDSEYRKFSMAAEMCSDKSNPRTHEVHRRVEPETSSPKEETTKTWEPEEDFNTSQSDDVIYKLQKDHNRATGMHQSSYSSDVQDEPLLQTFNTNICLDALILDTCQTMNDETHTDVKLSRSKRRMGSSRRFKGSQQVKEGTSEAHHETQEHNIETIKADECLQNTKMALETPMVIQEESDNLKLAEDSRQNESTRSNNTEKLSEEDMFFIQNVSKSTPSETVDLISNVDNFAFLKSSVVTEDNNETFNEETRDARELTESDTGHMTLIQTAQRVESDTLHISSHDDDASFTSTTEDVVDQTEVSETQNTEALTCDNDSFWQKIHGVKETQNCGEMADRSMDVQSLQQDDVGRKREDPTGEDDATQGIYISPQLVSAVDLPSNTGFSPSMDASNNSESERSHSGHCEIVRGKSSQKKRKMGSTRRSLLHRKQDEEKIHKETTDTDSDVRNLVEFEVVEQLQTCVEESLNENVSPASSETYKEQQDTVQTLSAHGGEHEQRGSHSNVQSTDSHVMPDIKDLLDPFPQQSVANNVRIVSTGNDANLKDVETDVNVAVQPPQNNNFTSIETQMSSETNRQKITNAEMVMGSSLPHLETTQVTHCDEKPEGVELTENQKDDLQNPNDTLESRHFNVKATTNRRRKMGSTRRGLGFQHKEETLHQHQEEEDQATELETPTTDETALTSTEFEEPELQLHSENSEDKEENIFETVERTHIDESHSKPMADQTAPQSKPAETEPQFVASSSSPSTSATMTQQASGGRRRKMGSHRKSHGAQYQKDQTMTKEAESKVSSITEACENTSTEEQRQESSSRDDISEVDESPRKPPTSFSDIKVQDSLRPMSEDPRSQSHHANATLNQESRTQPSLGEEFGSSGYNVVMIGDSGVGKTSFMKRARSGKFFFTLPASIGVDSFKWTVVVDGKHVVLHVWDTAGQERFRSITRQVFHRAQAFLLMYDISSPQSFSAVSYWASCIQQSAAENVIVLLLGNKSDSAERKVETLQGETLAKECNFGFMECSAATGDNVIESLESVARMLSQTCDSRREATVLHKEPEKKKGSRCC